MTDYSSLLDEATPTTEPGSKVDYSSLLDENYDQQAARNNIRFGVESNPDKAAKAQALAKRYALPIGVVEHFQPDYEARAKTDDAATAIDSSPALRGWLAADSNRAKVVHDDVGNLSSIDKALSYLGASAKAGGNDLLAAGAKLLNELVGFSEQDAAVLFKDKPAQLQQLRENSYAMGLSRFARSKTTDANVNMEALPQPVKDKYGLQRYDTLEEGKSAWRAPVKVLGDIIRSLPTTAALALTVFLTKGAATASEEAALVSGASAEAAKAAGVKAAEAMAIKFGAASEGSIGYAQQALQTQNQIESMPIDQVATSPAYQKLIDDGYDPNVARIFVASRAGEQAGMGAGAIDALTNMLGGKFLGEAIGEGGSFVKRTAKGFATEAITEGIQSPGEQLAQNAAVKINADPQQELLDGVLESALQGLAVGGLTGGAFAGVLGRHKRDELKAGTGEDQSALIEQLNTLAQASKVSQRDTDTFESFLEHATQDGPVPDIYIDAQTLKQSGIADQVAEVSPAIASQYQEALLHGTTIRIPTSEYLANIATKPELSKPLLDHLMTDPLGFSKAEATEFRATNGPALEAEIASVLEQSQGSDVFNASRDAVKQAVLDNLNAVGRNTPSVNETYATLVAARTAVRAGQLGITPEQMFQKQLLRVHGDSVGGRGFSQSGKIIYHGTSLEAAKIIESAGFDVTKSADGSIWFTDNKDIGEVAATGKGAVIERVIDESNLKLGGWAENDKYSTNELISQGYDGLKLEDGGETTYQIFNPDKLQSANILKQSAYHGSPHRFERFDLSKIGTGEGAQAYGWGQYFADAKDVAESYQRDLSNYGEITLPSKGVVKINYLPPAEKIAAQLWKNNKNFSDAKFALGNLSQKHMDASKADVLAELENLRDAGAHVGGQLYAVDIPDDAVAKMLDWDKPLSEQPHIMQALGIDPNKPSNLPNRPTPEMTGQELYYALSKGQTNLGAQATQKGASEFLLSKGIPGLRYFDGASRQQGKGTQNTVVWDQALLDQISEKLQTFYQGGVDRGGFSPSQNIITLLKNADLSTFEHELAHYFFENDIALANELVQKPTITTGEQSILDDVQTLLNWYGLKSPRHLRDNRSVESVPDSLKLDAKRISDLIVSESRKAQSDGFIRVESLERVFGHVLGALNNPEVFNSVVGSLPVDVVNLLASEKLSPDVVLHDAAMLKQVFAVNTPHGVAIPVERANALKALLDKVAISATELSGSLPDMGGLPRKVVSTTNTSDNLHDGEPTSLDIWNALSFEEKRAYHERFAESWESYLFTGKSPSIELAPYFQKFREFMLQVYKSLKAFLAGHPEAGKLNDEVRGVFDRMLATDEQIALAEQARSMLPLFKTAEEASKFGVDFETYQTLANGATQAAVETLQAQGLKDMQWLHNAHGREVTKLKKKSEALRREVRAEVRTEIMQRPVYQAWTFLTNRLKAKDKIQKPVIDTGIEEANRLELENYQAGQGLNLAEVAAGRLDAAEVAALDIPDAAKKRLEDFKMTRKEGGLHPDVVADLFGLTSGSDLALALYDADPPQAAIEKATDARMLAEHGELATPEAIAKAADAALYNAARGKMLVADANALANATTVRQGTDKNGRKRTINILPKVAREYAAALIARKRIRDIRPVQFEAAEIKAGKATEKAKNAGKIEEAAGQARTRLINYYAAMEAHSALAEVDKGVADVKHLLSKGAQKNMRGDALAQLNALAARFDFRSSLSNKEIEAAKVPLAEWVQAEAERLSAVVPELPAFVLNESYKKHYKDMTVEEFRGVIDAIEQLEFMARREQKQYISIRNQNFEQEREAVLAAIRKAHPAAFDADGKPKEPQRDLVPSLSKGLKKGAEKFLGGMVGPENIIDILEGGEFGPAFESLMSRMSHASDWKAENRARVLKVMRPLFKAYSIKERYDFSRKGFKVPEINLSMTRENAVMVAAYYGNPEGRDRLLNDGWGPAQVNAIFDHLTDKDLDLVEGMWKLFDHDLWPQLKALNERTRGKAPPKVVAAPFTVHGRQLTGGYMRLKYDSDLSSTTHNQDKFADLKALMGGGAGQSVKTNQGTSTERVQGVKRRLLLELGVFSAAVEETLHDIAYREAAADTYRMLMDHDVQGAISGSLGMPAHEALQDRILEVVSPPRSPFTWLEKTVSVARKNTVINLMSGVKTALQNLTGLGPALANVHDTQHLGQLLKEIGTPFKVSQWQFAMSQSSYMRGLATNFDSTLNEMKGKLSVKGHLLPSDASFLWLMSTINQTVAIPIWSAGFKTGMRVYANDAGKATDYADHLVRQSQGSGRDVDLAKIMSGHGAWGELKKALTMFTSYFNGQLGLLVRSGAIAAQEAKTNTLLAVSKFSAKFLAIVAIPAVLTQLMMTGGDDNDDNFAEKWGKVLGMYMLSMFPFIKDVAATAISIYSPDSKYHTGYRLSPIESSIETMIRAPGSIADMWSGAGSEADTKTAILGASFALKLPGKLISDTWRGTDAFLSGEAGPQAIVLGPPPR